MASAEEIRKQLEELRSEETALTNESKVLRKKKVDSNKVRVQCSGKDGIPCPDEAFEFFKTKSKFRWVCNKCLLRTESTLVVCNAKGYTKEWLERERFIYRHTLYTVKTKSGREIPVGFSGVPLFKNDLEDFKLLSITKDNLPKEYFWCIQHNEPWRRIKQECSECPVNHKCDEYQLYKSNKEVRELQVKLNELTVSDKLKEKSLKENKKDEKARLLEEQRIKEEKILAKFAPITKKICSVCKDDFKSSTSYWGYDGTRWVVQMPPKIQDNCIKYLCNSCLKDRG